MSLAGLVENGEYREAFSRAIELWRRKPHARLAGLVTELADLAKKERRLDDPRAVANEPSALPRLLETIFVSGNSVATLANLTTFLETKPADPRLFDWCVARLAHPPFDISNSNPRRLYSMIVETMSKLDDERVGPWVEQLPAFCEERKGRRHGQLSAEEIEALKEMFAACKVERRVPPPLTSEEEAAVAAVRVPLDALASQAEAVVQQRTALFEKVISDFSDDLAKEVFADFLLEHGDPLGEYIILSLKLARDGALPQEQEARHRALEDHASRFQPMGMRFEHGFAVEARFTDGEGIRRGSWGSDLGWGTIAISDVPPTSDDCHTESLRELVLGSTFIGDLAKLKRPLAVTKLSWVTPSQNGRAKWKKIRVLPELVHLVLKSPTDGAFEWTILEGPGASVRVLTVDPAWRFAHHIAWICALLAHESLLERVALGPHLVFARTGGMLTLAISVRDAGVQADLERELEAAPRSLVDEVIVDGPGDAATYAALLTLGRTSRVVSVRSAAADAARLTRKQDTFRIEPGPEHPLFDAPALRWLLAAAKEKGWTGRRVTVASGAQIERAGAYYAAVLEHGGSELELLAGPPLSRRGRLSLAITTGPSLEIELGREDLVEVFASAIATLGARPVRLRVRHSPYLRDLAGARARLETIADGVELVADEEVFVRMFNWACKAKRLAIDPAGATHALMPATLDAILAVSGAVKEIRIGHLELPLVPWLEWVSLTKRAVLFSRDWKSNVMRQLAWDRDGVNVRLGIDLRWDRIAALLVDVPPRAIKKLTVTADALPPPSIEEECRRVAASFETLRVTRMQ